ncbi:hypothetical protein DM01DRAFT_298746 [Hesseltinella vesiculosa]|uniref:Uncharacterized protein n=1 Tax=Hesseltinella vesiculosa TaxID=101127 RepID=A0A1X2GGY2_9FUNG|nr:hypothetical protein DM01DRAFT_298746 [Hesseltinella vesiculosa]
MTQPLNSSTTSMSQADQDRLKEEIAQLRREWVDLVAKDDMVKQHIDEVRQKIRDQESHPSI